MTHGFQEEEVGKWEQVCGAASLVQALIEQRTMRQFLVVLGSVPIVLDLKRVVATTQRCYQLRNRSAENSAMGVDG